MRIIILGGGSIGGSVAKELSSEENDVIVIDNNSDHLEELKNKEGIATILGNANKHASKLGLIMMFVVCLTDSEETNLLASIVGKEQFNGKSI